MLKVDEDSQEFINEIYKRVGIIGVSMLEKGVALFEQWKGERAIDADPLDSEKSKGALCDCFFSLTMTEEKKLEFINLRHGNMSVKQYTLNSLKWLIYFDYGFWH